MPRLAGAAAAAGSKARGTASAAVAAATPFRRVRRSRDGDVMSRRLCPTGDVETISREIARERPRTARARPARGRGDGRGAGADRQIMSRPLRTILGVILVLVGALWTLQGLGVVGGSAMSG